MSRQDDSRPDSDALAASGLVSPPPRPASSGEPQGVASPTMHSGDDDSLSEAGEEIAKEIAAAQQSVSSSMRSLPDSEAVHAEALLQRFEVRRQVGTGGFGNVFEAFDPVLKRRVAIKMPRFDRQLSPTWRARFLREAELAATLNHPNIVQVFETIELGEMSCIVSAFVDGPNLEQWLRTKSRSVFTLEAVSWVRCLADAVHHAHQRGIIHRDIKPGNILLEQTDDGCWTPKLTDFGLARWIDLAHSKTETGDVLGTPAYMAPEQADGRRKDIGVASDLYALGVVLYELLAGRPPFQSESKAELLRAVLLTEPVSPRQFNSAIPRDLESICLKCLAKSPADRYGSAQELADDLRRFQEAPTHQGPPTAAFAAVRTLVQTSPWRGGYARSFIRGAWDLHSCRVRV